MAMQEINPTETQAWKQLTSHYKELKNTHLKSLFSNDNDRKDKFTTRFNDFEFDYSKNRITEETIKLLIELANEVDLKSAIEAYYTGEKIDLAFSVILMLTLIGAGFKTFKQTEKE